MSKQFTFGSEAIKELIADQKWHSVGMKLKSMYSDTEDTPNWVILTYLDGLQDASDLMTTPLRVRSALSFLKQYLQQSLI